MTLRSQFARDLDKKPPPIGGAEEYFRTVGGLEKVLCNVKTSDATLRPWFTLVLGSGCSSGDGLEVTLSSLMASLETRVSELYDGAASQRVGRFGEDLIGDRFRPPPPLGNEKERERTYHPRDRLASSLGRNTSTA